MTALMRNQAPFSGLGGGSRMVATADCSGRPQGSRKSITKARAPV